MQPPTMAPGEPAYLPAGCILAPGMDLPASLTWTEHCREEPTQEQRAGSPVIPQLRHKGIFWNV